MGDQCRLLGSLATTRFLTSLSFEVQPADPILLAGVVGILWVVALAACYFPARRAARTDPMVALRCE